MLDGLQEALKATKEKFKQEKSLGISASSAASRRPEKKIPLFDRKNSGLATRITRDTSAAALTATESAQLEASKRALERKAKIYDALHSGQLSVEDVNLASARMERMKRPGGFSSASVEKSALLIDFEQKRWVDPPRAVPSSQLKQDEPIREEQDVVGTFFEDTTGTEFARILPTNPSVVTDGLVEVVDDFGRSRMVKRQDLPQRTPTPPPDAIKPTTYEWDRDRREREALEAMNRIVGPEYYDDTKEVRQMGAGYYKFSKEEEQRRKEQRELAQLREETLRARGEYESAMAKRERLQIEQQAELEKAAKRRRNEDKGAKAFAKAIGKSEFPAPIEHSFVKKRRKLPGEWDSEDDEIEQLLTQAKHDAGIL